LALTYILLYCFPVAFLPIPSPGITTAVILILFGLGLNSLFVGIIGEYTGRIYGQGKQRPIYIVDDKIGW
jgi:dolichol-phosphate mannosyltransferase